MFDQLVKFRNVRPYWQVAKTAAREDSVNISRLILGVAFSLARIAFLAAIYRVAYRSGPSALPYANAIWGMGFYATFVVNLGVRQIFKSVEHEVISGTIEVNLIRPLGWRLTKVCEHFGRKSIEFFVQIAILPIFLTLLIGPPNIGYVSPAFFAVFIVLIFWTLVSMTATFLTIGFAAFWLNNAKAVQRIFGRIVVVFGGGYIPIALLPPLAQEVLRYSPFEIYSLPTQFFNPAIADNLLPTLAITILWSALIIILCQLVWTRAQRRIEINGG